MYPEYFEARERALLGERFDSLFAAPEAPARGLTVNGLRCTPQWLTQRLDAPLTPSPFCPTGLVLGDSELRLGKHPYHHAGAFYLQEPSASAPAALLEVQPGHRVLDMCAAPGGKSSQLAAALQGQGLLVSNEYNAGRAEIERIEEFYPNPAMQEYIRNTRNRVESVREKMKEFPGGLDKIQAVFKRIDDRDEAMRRLKREPSLAVTGALFNNIEVNAKGVDKGNGLLKLGEMLGIKREEIMACGDGLNDLAMIQKVGLGVAMANASEEVKEAADYVTAGNEEDGVAKAIEKFVLNEKELPV